MANNCAVLRQNSAQLEEGEDNVAIVSDYDSDPEEVINATPSSEQAEEQVPATTEVTEEPMETEEMSTSRLVVSSPEYTISDDEDEDDDAGLLEKMKV